MKHLCGASSTAGLNPENWIDLDKIMHYVRVYRKTIEVNVSNEIELFKSVNNDDRHLRARRAYPPHRVCGGGAVAEAGSGRYSSESQDSPDKESTPPVRPPFKKTAECLFPAV